MSVSFKRKICSILIESSQTNLLKLCQNVSPGRKVRQEYPGYAVLFYPVAFFTQLVTFEITSRICQKEALTN